MNDEIKSVEIGDFIQLNSWFGDVWAEVTDSFGNMFVYIIYSKGGESRWEVLQFCDQIRKVIKKADIESNVGTLMRGVLHSQHDYIGSGHKHWDHPIKRGKYKSQHPEHFQGS